MMLHPAPVLSVHQSRNLHRSPFCHAQAHQTCMLLATNVLSSQRSTQLHSSMAMAPTETSPAPESTSRDARRNRDQDIGLGKPTVKKWQQLRNEPKTGSQPQVGSLVTGTVDDIHPWGLVLRCHTGHRAMLHISNVSFTRVEDMAAVFKAGDEVTALVVSAKGRGRSQYSRLPQLSTKKLESEPGQMLRDRAAVAASAPQVLQLIAEGRPPLMAQVTHNDTGSLKAGDVVNGVITAVQVMGFFVDCENGTGGTAVGFIHTSQVSSSLVRDFKSVFSVGEQIKALVVKVDAVSGRVTLSTRALEPKPGGILQDKQTVWDNAALAAAKFKAAAALM